MANLLINGKFPITVDIPTEVHQLLINAKDSLTETAGKAVTTVTQNTSKVVENFTVTAGNAQETFSQTASNAIGTAVQTKDSLAQTAVKTVSTVTATTNEAINTLTDTALQTGNSLKGSVEGTFHQADQLSKVAATAVENAISALINHQLDAANVWIEAHPAVFWASKALIWGINHPIISTVIILLAIFALWQLVKAFGSLVEKVFLSILKSPFRLVHFLWKASFKPREQFVTSRKIKQTESDISSLMTAIPPSIRRNQKERLAYVLTRLEVIRQEQNDLLQEVTEILANDSHATESPASSHPFVVSRNEVRNF